MSKIYCRTCRTHREPVGFVRDDPVLSCGHTKHRTKSDDVIQKTRQEVEAIFTVEAAQRGISVEEVRAEYIRGLLDLFTTDEDAATTVGYCETCGTVTIIEDKDGVGRCGGNLMDNPGCGMTIKPCHHTKI